VRIEFGRTAYFCGAEQHFTWATPLTVETRWAMRVSVNSSTSESGSVVELSAHVMTAVVRGVDLRNDGAARVFLRQPAQRRRKWRIGHPAPAIDRAVEAELAA